MARWTHRAPLLALALLLALPSPAAAQTKVLSLQQKQDVMAAVRLRLRDPTAKFKWLPVANDSVYCGLINTAKTQGYLPFQVFGNFAGKLTANIASDRTTTAAMRQACERYGYNFSAAVD